MKYGIPAWLIPLQRLYEDRVASRLGPESRKALVLLAAVLAGVLVQVRVTAPLAAQTESLETETAGREQEIRLYERVAGTGIQDVDGLSRQQREELRACYPAVLSIRAVQKICHDLASFCQAGH